MASTASFVVRSFEREFLYGILCLAVLILIAFGTWVGVRRLAVIEAFTRLYAYIVRLFEKQPFRFLDLPPEIRELVYRHHFALYWSSRYRQRFQDTAMLPDAILGVNRQIYEEAAHVLYSKEIILIKIISLKRLNCGERPFGGDVFQVPHILRHVKTVILRICWPHLVWYRWPETGVRHGCSVTALKENMKTTCAALATLPNLRTIRINFAVEVSSHHSERRSPAKDCIPSLLRPLKLIRRANPDVVVEMPDYCPISTAELAEQQQWHEYEYMVEVYEDHKEWLAISMAVDESFGRMDGGNGW